MNTKQLESFLTIAKLGSFAAAAERLHVTQSTISARIQELEETLGVALFDRSQRQVHLTPKGRDLIAYAQQVSDLFAEIKEQIASTNSMTGVVRVGVTELVALTWLSNFAKLVRKEYPGILLEFAVGLNPFLLEGIRNGELDIAVIAGPTSDTELCASHLGNVHFYWMCGSTFELPEGTLNARDLRKLPIIYQGTDSFTTQVTNRWLGLPTIKRQRGTSCNSLAAVKSLTVAGVGISLLPDGIFADSLASGELARLSTNPPGLDMPFTVIYLERSSSKLLAEIASLCKVSSSFN
ncbi:LysR family transcriptional regulator [Cupriavidus sp. TA19]|uniref:LysR family transcriptional regulator n=1 Tax=Cupriavidus sp. TA19 TaxID=701108 RepID=UPI0027294BC3|nr:LysR family transcriptional regulator [Cupriavidus sp. TA19]GLC96478.1 LysR family transcriptional regulator [Cupriavidus sp. TA19]